MAIRSGPAARSPASAGAAASSGTGSGRRPLRVLGDGGDFSEFFRTFFAGTDMDPNAQPRTSTRSRARAAQTETGQRNGGGTIDDILANLGLRGRKGGGGSTGEHHRGSGAPVETQIDVTLEDAFAGATRVLEVNGKRLEVRIPPGVEPGSRIRLRGKGGDGPAAPDLVLVMRVTPHAIFTREGADITRELPVTLREALTGADVPVRTLGGRVLLKIPAGTQPGRLMRLAGQGMPRLKGEGRGDLFVKIKVVLPNLDEAGRTDAAALLDRLGQADPRAGL